MREEPGGAGSSCQGSRAAPRPLTSSSCLLFGSLKANSSPRCQLPELLQTPGRERGACTNTGSASGAAAGPGSPFHVAVPGWFLVPAGSGLGCALVLMPRCPGRARLLELLCRAGLS